MESLIADFVKFSSSITKSLRLGYVMPALSFLLFLKVPDFPTSQAQLAWQLVRQVAHSIFSGNNLVLF